MTRRVRYLIDTPNATLGGDSYRPGRKGDMGAEAWVPEANVAEAVKWGFISAAPGEWRVSDIRRVTEAILAALPPPGGDDEGEG